MRHLGADAVNQFAQRQHRVGSELLGADVIGYFLARVGILRSATRSVPASPPSVPTPPRNLAFPLSSPHDSMRRR